VPVTVEIDIQGISIDINKWSIRRDSKEEKSFISLIINGVKNLDTSSIVAKEDLENIIQQLAAIFEHAWQSNSKLKHITKHSKEWWNSECTDSLNRYRASGDIQYWKEFKANMYSVLGHSHSMAANPKAR